MDDRADLLYRLILPVLLFCRFTLGVFAYEANGLTENGSPSMFLVNLGYDFMRMDGQAVRSPSAGIGFLAGEHNVPFTQVGRRFFCQVLYRHFFFPKEPWHGRFHQIDAVFYGRISRQLFLFYFESAADRPIAGGLGSFETGFGWGYEVLRRPQMSLILGALLSVGDFGIALPSGAVLPVLPLPLVRLGIDTQWLALSLNLFRDIEFTIAPKERIRLTGDMRMDGFRDIGGMFLEATLWYRLFGADSRLGDIAGIGVGIGNDATRFYISRYATEFEMRRTSVFAVADFSLLSIRAGWIFSSRHLLDGKTVNDQGRGFYVSVQGMVPILIPR